VTTSEVDRAIESTASALPDLEDVGGALRRWVASEAFAGVVARLTAGDRDLADDTVVAQFIDATAFYTGDDTEGAARELLRLFLANLLDQLLRTSRFLCRGFVRPTS
jgi:hypothetical protein